MGQRPSDDSKGAFRLLSATQGTWGQRIAENIGRWATDWRVSEWAAPPFIPPIVEDPEDFLPEDLPPADLILSLGESPGLAQLIPDLALKTGAKAVIAPIDHEKALPPGLARQLEGWLAEIEVAVVFPKPFCSLTDRTFNRPPLVQTYDDPVIRRFAARFGRPQFRIEAEDDRITKVEVLRHSACGSTGHIAGSLPGVPLERAAEKAALSHHHYPCMASMEMDPHYQDTLMHVSGNLVKDSMQDAVNEHKPPEYIRPQGHVGSS